MPRNVQIKGRALVKYTCKAEMRLVYVINCATCCFAIWDCIRINHKFSVLVFDEGSFAEIELFLKGAITFNLDEVLEIELSQLITTK